MHPLEPLLKSTGLRRACLFLDAAGTLHRCAWNRGDGELAVLPAEQVYMVLILLNAKPGSDAWTWAETRIGTKLNG